MPLSLRLPSDLETEIASYGARLGISKSAVIVHSIREFLQRNAKPSAFDLYEHVMRDDRDPSSKQNQDLTNAETDAVNRETRPHKQAIREAFRRKHAARSARSSP